jgi:hypothetical protein
LVYRFAAALRCAGAPRRGYTKEGAPFGGIDQQGLPTRQHGQSDERNLAIRPHAHLAVEVAFLLAI